MGETSQWVELFEALRDDLASGDLNRVQRWVQHDGALAEIAEGISRLIREVEEARSGPAPHQKEDDAMSDLPRLNDGSLAAYTWAGGYPIYYICKNDERIFTACAHCARKVDQGLYDGHVVDAELNWKEIDLFYSVEAYHLYCTKCGEPIECKHI